MDCHSYCSLSAHSCTEHVHGAFRLYFAQASKRDEAVLKKIRQALVCVDSSCGRKVRRGTFLQWKILTRSLQFTLLLIIQLSPLSSDLFMVIIPSPPSTGGCSTSVMWSGRAAWISYHLRKSPCSSIIIYPANSTNQYHNVPTIICGNLQEL